jgi:hypothetical protein
VYNRPLTAAEIHTIARVPEFASFTPRAAVKLGPHSQDDSFTAAVQFRLNADSDGIDPVHEDVAFTLGSFSTTIPAENFQQQRPQLFTFTGAINNVDLQAQIRVPPGSAGVAAERGKPKAYSFTLRATGANLDGTVVPPEVQLTIGDDTGRAELNVGKAGFGQSKEGEPGLSGDDD